MRGWGWGKISECEGWEEKWVLHEDKEENEKVRCAIVVRMVRLSCLSWSSWHWLSRSDAHPHPHLMVLCHIRLSIFEFIDLCLVGSLDVDRMRMRRIICSWLLMCVSSSRTRISTIDFHSEGEYTWEGDRVTLLE